jgi:MoaA/NifB/PqqE/SkfB family radical SAM enzyme
MTTTADQTGEVAFPSYVDVEPFDPCNLKCAFCFGPDFVTLRHKSRPPSAWREVFAQLAARGVEGVVVSGGEPTMYRGRENGQPYTIATLLESAKAHGLRTTMSTNTTAPDILRLSAPFLDWIAIPIDAVSPDSQERLRGFVTSLPTLDALITDLREINPGLKVKLGSVATAWNIADIIELSAELAAGRIAVDTWKIYQFAARRMALTRGVADSLHLSDTEFADLRSTVERSWTGDPGFRTTWSALNDRSGAYLFIYSNGDVVIPNLLNGASDHTVGNLFDSGPQVLDQVTTDIESLHRHGQLSLGNNTKNYLDTY